MIACPVCGEGLDLELEVPVGTLWDLMVGGVICGNCGREIGVIHPATVQPVPGKR
jgi:transcription elongation factor Elf1